VLATNHKEFDYGPLLTHGRAVVDTRSALKGRRSPKIVRL